MKKKLLITLVTLLLSFLGTGFQIDVASTPEEEEFFTIVLIPDTQIYTCWHQQFYYDQTQWIADNEESLNIKFVIH